MKDSRLAAERLGLDYDSSISSGYTDRDIAEYEEWSAANRLSAQPEGTPTAMAKTQAPATSPEDQDNVFTRAAKKFSLNQSIAGNMASRNFGRTAELVSESTRYAEENPGMQESADIMAGITDSSGVYGDGPIGSLFSALDSTSEYFKKDIGEEQGFINKTKAAGRNVKALGETMVEQVPNMVPGFTGMFAGGAAMGAAGSVVPVLGTATGVATGSFLGMTAGNASVEVEGQIQHDLQKAGIDPRDTESVKKFLDDNWGDIALATGKKGAFITAVDLFSMKIGGRILGAAERGASNRALTKMGVDVLDKKAVGKALETTKYTELLGKDKILKKAMSGTHRKLVELSAGALEPITEYVGELGGNYLATGEIDYGGALQEALMSMGQSGVTAVGVNAYSRGKSKLSQKNLNKKAQELAGGVYLGDISSIPDTELNGLIDYGNYLNDNTSGIEGMEQALVSLHEEQISRAIKTTEASGQFVDQQNTGEYAGQNDPAMAFMGGRTQLANQQSDTNSFSQKITVDLGVDGASPAEQVQAVGEAHGPLTKAAVVGDMNRPRTDAEIESDFFAAEIEQASRLAVESDAKYAENNPGPLQLEYDPMKTRDGEFIASQVSEMRKLDEIENERSQRKMAVPVEMGTKETIPENIRVDMAKKADELVREDPVHSAMATIRKQGGLSKEQLLQDYDQDTVKLIAKKYPGLVTTSGTIGVDSISTELGFVDGQDLVAKMSGAKTQKEYRAEMLRNLEGEYHAGAGGVPDYQAGEIKKLIAAAKDERGLDNYRGELQQLLETSPEMRPYARGFNRAIKSRSRELGILNDLTLSVKDLNEQEKGRKTRNEEKVQRTGIEADDLGGQPGRVLNGEQETTEAEVEAQTQREKSTKKRDIKLAGEPAGERTENPPIETYDTTQLERDYSEYVALRDGDHAGTTIVNNEEGRAYILEDLASAVYKAGMRFSQFAKEVRAVIGKAYDSVKPKLKKLFKELSAPLRNEIGAIGDLASETKGDLAYVKKNFKQQYKSLKASLRAMPTEERTRVNKALQKHNKTLWSMATIRSLVIRDMLNLAISGNEYKHLGQGLFWGGKGYDVSKGGMFKALESGEAGLIQFASSYEFFASNSKAEIDFSVSLTHCEPSSDCAKFCYSTNGHGGLPSALKKAEFTNLMAEKHPEILKHRLRNYKFTAQGASGLALRVNEKGDLSKAVVKIINELSEEGIRFQVFSKRPELLREVSKSNWRALSIDASNTTVAKENPDLPLAVVVTDGLSDSDLESLSDRVNVTLPVSMKGSSLTRDGMKKRFPKAYKKISKTICPINSLDKKVVRGTTFVSMQESLKTKSHNGAWTCPSCDATGSTGCFFGGNSSGKARAISEQVSSDVSDVGRKAEEKLKQLYDTGAIDNETFRAISDAIALRSGGTLPNADGRRGKEGGGVDHTGVPEAEDRGGKVGENAGVKYTSVLPDGQENFHGDKVPFVAEHGQEKIRSLFETEPQVGGNPFVGYQHKIGTLKYDGNPVSGFEEASSILEPIGKRSQETMMVLGLDDNNMPLGVLQHSVGGSSSNQIFLAELLGAMHNMTGVESFWLAHNHPSGNSEMSEADARLTETIKTATDGTGISLVGHVVITPDRKTTHIDPIGAMQEVAMVKKTGGPKNVKIVERRIKGDRPNVLSGTSIRNSADAKVFIEEYSKGASGVLLLNTALSPVKFVHLSVKEMGAAKGTQLAKKILGNADNAPSAYRMIFNFPRNSKKSKDAAVNMFKFANASGLDTLDAFVGGESMANDGEGPGRYKGETMFFSKTTLKQTLESRGLAGDKLLNAIDTAEEIVANGGEITPDGDAVLYHRTTKVNADKIKAEKAMTGKEPGIFFGTRPGGQIEGYGEAVVSVSVPVEDISIDDVFGDEAHVTISAGVMGKKIPVNIKNGKTSGTGESASNVRKAITSLLGEKGLSNMEKSGALKIVPRRDSIFGKTERVKELKSNYGERIAGYYDPTDQSITLITDNLKEGDAEYVMLHEGIHLLLDSDKRFKETKAELLGEFESLQDYDGKSKPKRKDSKAVQEAFRQARIAEPNGSKELIREEAIAYFVQNKANHNTSLFRKIMARIRAALRRAGIPIKNLNNDDYIAIFTSGLKARAKRKLQNKTTLKNSDKIRLSNDKSKGFNEWSKGAEVIGGEGILNAKPDTTYVYRVSHGTTHEFNIFDPTISGNNEGAFGAVNYFTSSEGDADLNYTAEGPDLTQRIETRAERLYDDLYEMSPEDATEAFGRQVNEDTDLQRLAVFIAKEELAGTKPHVKDVYVRLDNPAYIGGETVTYIENGNRDQYSDEAIEYVKDELDATDEQIDDGDFDDEIEQYIDDASMYDSPPILEAITNAVNEFETDVDIKELYKSLELYEDTVTATELHDAMATSEHLSYAQDFESANGDLISSHIIGQVFKNLGYDGIVLQNADRRFTGMNMEPGTSRIHVFEDTPSQIKSADGNNGDFDPNNPDIRKSRGRDSRVGTTRIKFDGNEAEVHSFDMTDGIKNSATTGMPLFAKDNSEADQKRKEWFAGSKITDEDGSPMTMYHGSSVMFKGDDPKNWKFDKMILGKSSGHASSGLGFFFTPQKGLARKYSGGGQVAELNLKINNPYKMTIAESQRFETVGDAIKRRAELMRDGYDGVIIQTGDPKTDYYVAFESNQAKTTTNTTYGDTGDIRYSKYANEPKTKTAVADEHRALTGTETLNATNGSYTSNSMVEIGRQEIRFIYEDMKTADRTKAAVKKYSDKKLIELQTELTDAMGILSDTHKSIAEKERFVASLGRKLPKPVRAELLTALSVIARFKGDEAIGKRTVDAIKKANKVLSKHYVKEITDKLTKAIKKPKRGRNMIQKGRGREFEKQLEYLRLIIGAKEGDVAVEANRLSTAIDSHTQKLMNATSESDYKSIESELLTAQDKLNHLDVVGALKSKPFEDVVKARDYIEQIKEDGISAWKAKREALKERNERNRLMVMQEVSGDKNPQVETVGANRARINKERNSVWKKFTNGLSFMSNGIQSYETMLDKVTAKSGMGPLQSKTVTHFGSLAHAATRDKEAMLLDSHEMIRAKAEEIFGGSVDTAFHEASQQVHNIPVFDDSGNQKEVIPMSEMEIAYWFAVEKGSIDNESIAETFEKHGITSDSFSAMNKALSPKVKQWTEWIVTEFMEDFYTGINDVYSEVEGIDLKKTKFYIPLMRKLKGNIEPVQVGFMEQTQNGSMKKGSLKERVKNTNMFKVIDLNQVLMNHVEDMTHYKAWAIPTLEMRGTFSSPDVKELIAQHHGYDAVKTITRFTDDFISSDKDKFDKIPGLDKIRSNVTIAMVGMNPVVGAKQLTSIPAMAADIPLADWMAGTGYAIANPIEAWKELSEKSPLLKARSLKGYDKEMGNVSRRDANTTITGALGLVDKLKEMSMLGVKFGDKSAIVAGGWAIYNYHKKKALSEKKSVKEAEQIGIDEFEKSFERSQQSRNTMSRGTFLRGGSGQNLFTMFMTAPASYSRMLEVGIRGLVNSKTPEGKAKAFKTTIIYGVVLPMVFQGIADAMLGIDGDDEEKKAFWENQYRAVAMGYLNGMPLARDFQKMIGNVMQGNGWYRDQFTPVLSMAYEGKDGLSNFLKFIKGGTSRISKEEYQQRMLMNLMHFSGYGIGVPTKPIGRISEGISDSINNNTERKFRASMGYSRSKRGYTPDKINAAYKKELGKITDVLKEYKSTNDRARRTEIRATKEFSMRRLARKTASKIRKKKEQIKKLKEQGRPTGKQDIILEEMKKNFIEKVK